ncbi:MAG: AmmeMemoRadiSam system radical SAM enzyme [Lachnospiraceae bacterium]|nr:AmmeMemoRadiSam system radical SAM enzyme [Lachnospiraceae bacterium]
MAVCDVCFRHCDIKEGNIGFCMARGNVNGIIKPLNYGRITSLALDPIEKKPLKCFYPGKKILSVGSYGCNLRCPFCQNHEISWGKEVKDWPKYARKMTPKELVLQALSYKEYGNIGIAFTYNEPLVGYEFIKDTAKLVHDEGMVNVVVSNGTASLTVLNELAPFIDAMNIDLKGFNADNYNSFLGGNFEMTTNFIRVAAGLFHVELTTLIVPGFNDSEEEMKKLSSWIASITDETGRVRGEDIPLHISRFFPSFKLDDAQPTDVELIYHLKDIASENLKYVYTGNC